MLISHKNSVDMLICIKCSMMPIRLILYLLNTSTRDDFQCYVASHIHSFSAINQLCDAHIFSSRDDNTRSISIIDPACREAVSGQVEDNVLHYGIFNEMTVCMRCVWVFCTFLLRICMVTLEVLVKSYFHLPHSSRLLQWHFEALLARICWIKMNINFIITTRINSLILSNRKWQDYVYTKWEYWSTM